MMPRSIDNRAFTLFYSKLGTFDIYNFGLLSVAVFRCVSWWICFPLCFVLPFSPVCFRLFLPIHLLTLLSASFKKASLTPFIFLSSCLIFGSWSICCSFHLMCSLTTTSCLYVLM